MARHCQEPAPPTGPAIWESTLAGFREQVTQGPTPAGVAVSAVCASFALGLVAMCLKVTDRKKTFAGDRKRLRRLLETAGRESSLLMKHADADVAAFNRYLSALRISTGGESQRKHRRAIDSALRRATEVPVKVARSAVAGLALCIEAADLVHDTVAADLGAAAAILGGAARATLRSVASNARHLRFDSRFYREVTAERRKLEQKAERQADQTLKLTLQKLSSTRDSR